MNRLQEKYKTTVVPALVKEFSYTTVMQAPKLDKIVINIGVGDAIADAMRPARSRLRARPRPTCAHRR